MSTQAMGTLCEILENGGGRFRLVAYPEADIEALEQAGLVVRDGVVSSVLCDSCDHGHLAEVRRSADGVWGYRCPEAGFVGMPPDEIAARKVNPEAMLARLAGALHVTRRARADISRQILPIGSFLLGEISSFAWLATCLSSPDEYAALHAEIRRRSFPEFGAVFMTAEVAVSPFQLPANHHLISLRDVAGFDADGHLSLDGKVLRAFVPKAERIRPGRPSGEEATWNVIQRLIEKSTFPNGLNARQRAISTAYPEVYGDRPVPAQSTIKTHLVDLKPRIDELVGS